MTETVEQVFARLMSACEGGFNNEHHHAAWLRKHRKEIEALPVSLGKRVLFAHEQATARTFSKGVERGR